jgi:NAD(P)-dependent dehydrogenase (short-subunit alcohol dehydrogenase family)
VFRTAVVTGATSGLGLECARALAHRPDGWRVVLAVRDQDRGHAAAGEIGAPERVSVLPLDLASLRSVGAFPAELDAAGLPPLGALVCNAGVQVASGDQRTADGFELTFGTNHLGHFALVQGLVTRLSPPARVVIVASDTHDPARRTGMPAPRYTSAVDLAYSGELRPGRELYTTSKLCNVLFAYELDRRLELGARGISVNAFNPGLMPGSGLARDYGALQRFAWRFLMPAMRVFPQVRSAAQSGRHLAALAADPAFDSVTGRYFDGLQDTPSSLESHDLEKARDLWETSRELVASGH